MKDEEINSKAFKYYKPILKSYTEEWEEKLSFLMAENEYLKWKITNIEEKINKIITILGNKLDESNSRVINYEKRYLVLSRQQWKCNQCGKKLKYKKENEWVGEVAHIDHIFPYTKREKYPKGEPFINDLDNLQALCEGCNLKKGKKEVH